MRGYSSRRPNAVKDRSSHDVTWTGDSRSRRTQDVEAEEEEVILNVIEKGREQVSHEILARAAQRTANRGIELLDLRIKRINSVEDVQKDVFAGNPMGDWCPAGPTFFSGSASHVVGIVLVRG